MDGFYKLFFEGRGGSGYGAIALKNGRIAGLDVGEMVYDGTYSTDGAGSVSGTVRLRNSSLQPGALVTGSVIAPGQSFEVRFDVVTGSGGQHTLHLQTPTGPVTANLTKVAEL